MTRDDVAPLGTDDSSFPCEKCGGSGTVWADLGTYHKKCQACGGSGYGVPPQEAVRLRAHCLSRLSKWAHRALPSDEA